MQAAAISTNSHFILAFLWVLLYMKTICILLAKFLFIHAIQGQNCNTLDKEPFFTSIKFGGQIPDNLASCSKEKIVDLSTYKHLRIAYDSLKGTCKKLYADLFSYHKVRFLNTQIEADNKGRITTVNMYSFLDKKVAGSTITYNPPAEYTALYKKLQSLYGKPVAIEMPTQMDSLLIRERGMTQKVGWYCSDIFLELRVSYGAEEKFLNMLSVNIRNTAFDLPEVEKLFDSSQ